MNTYLVGPHIHFIEILKFVKCIRMKRINIYVYVNSVFPKQDLIRNVRITSTTGIFLKCVQ